MKLEVLSSRLGKFAIKAIGIGSTLMAVVLLFAMAWGGAYPSYDPNPPVLIPRQGDVWHVGELHTVQWNVDGIPTTNSSGQPVLALLILAYWTQTSEPKLLKDQPLTDWVPITDKIANVIVPTVPTRSDYAIFLRAHDDRSSCSGTITIFNPDDPTGSGVPPRSLEVTTAPPVSVTVSLPPPASLPQTVSSNDTSTPISSPQSSTMPTPTDSPTPTPTPTQTQTLSPRMPRILPPSASSANCSRTHQTLNILFATAFLWMAILS